MILDVTQRYKHLLKECGVLGKREYSLVDPTSEDIVKSKRKVVILQQGYERWGTLVRDKIKYIITLSVQLKERYDRMGIPTFLIEFPLQNNFKKTKQWTKRISGIYYHGRIISEKLPYSDLIAILNSGISVTLRGPICKEYWSKKDLTDTKFVKYKELLLALDSKYKNLTLLPQTDDESIIIEELNNHKFYFTLSTGEAFNVALQEAIACGTIPIVRRNPAYWWANYLHLSFNDVDDLIAKYSYLVNEDIEEYSDVIAKEIKMRCSFEAIKEKYKKQLKALA